MPPSADEMTLRNDIGSFSLDPLGYVLYAFPWGVKGTELEHAPGPRKWQRKFLADLGEKLRAGKLTVEQVIREATASGHGIGKSALVSMLLKFCVDTREKTRGVVTANTENQLRTKTWPELAKWHRLSLTSHWFVLTATALYSADPASAETWRIDAIPWSENNTEAFAGLHNEGKRIVLVFDEASKIADKVWEVAEGALTDLNTEIMWFVFGNPTRATGRFRECFRRFRNRWNTRNIDARDVEGTNAVQHAEWIVDYGEDSDFVKVRVRGMFPSASARSLISEEDVDPAFGRHLREDQYSWAPKILTCDPAWTGDDLLVIGLRQGLAFFILKAIPKNDNDVFIANMLARLEDEHKADAVFIDMGYGTGIASVGQSLGRPWRLVSFAEKAGDQGCFNKRAEMWKEMRDWLKSGGAIPAIQQLRDDLLGPETKPRADGKLLLESKEDMKARGIPSPNYGDALALSFAYPVAPRDMYSGSVRHSAVTEYDPFAAMVS